VCGAVQPTLPWSCETLCTRSSEGHRSTLRATPGHSAAWCGQPRTRSSRVQTIGSVSAYPTRARVAECRLNRHTARITCITRPLSLCSSYGAGGVQDDSVVGWSHHEVPDRADGPPGRCAGRWHQRRGEQARDGVSGRHRARVALCGRLERCTGAAGTLRVRTCTSHTCCGAQHRDWTR
jgi:hypothetical protein